MPRPRVLDAENKQVICALTTAGMSVTKIAEYVGCSRSVIYRERHADADFDEAVRRARMRRDLSPLEAMRRAASKYWRAAAWMIDRDDRRIDDRRARRYQSKYYTEDDLAELAQKVKQALGGVIFDPLDGSNPPDRIDAAFREMKVAKQQRRLQQRRSREPDESRQDDHGVCNNTEGQLPPT